MIVAGAFVVMLLHGPSQVSDEQAWAALAKSELARGNACNAFFYRLRLYERTRTEAAAYYAFQTAYAADMLAMASKLLTHINDPKLLAVLDANRRELTDRASVGALRDAACPAHRAMCGDFIVETPEQYDDADNVGARGHQVCVLKITQHPEPFVDKSADHVALPPPDKKTDESGLTREDVVAAFLIPVVCGAGVALCYVDAAIRGIGLPY